MVGRDELLRELRRSGREVSDTLRTLEAEKFEEGRYEGGWNARQILAHVASVEWTYPRLLDLAGGPLSEQGEARTPDARGGFDAYNARQVEKRALVSPSDLLAEFQRNRAQTIAAVEKADPQLLERPIRSAGGARGTLGDVLMQVAVDHVEQHLKDILETSTR